MIRIRLPMPVLIEHGEEILILKGCMTKEQREDFLAKLRSISWATIILGSHGISSTSN